MAALLAASRGAEPMVAEQARELLPARYPLVYEFQKALELDPSNVELRRELAYLHLEMKNGAAAGKEFAAVLERAPDDLLSAAQLGFLRLNEGDAEGALPLLQKALASRDDELADRVRAALKLPPATPSLRRRTGDAAPSSGDALKLGE